MKNAFPIRDISVMEDVRESMSHSLHFFGSLSSNYSVPVGFSLWTNPIPATSFMILGYIPKESIDSVLYFKLTVVFKIAKNIISDLARLPIYFIFTVFASDCLGSFPPFGMMVNTAKEMVTPEETRGLTINFRFAI